MIFLGGPKTCESDGSGSVSATLVQARNTDPGSRSGPGPVDQYCGPVMIYCGSGSDFGNASVPVPDPVSIPDPDYIKQFFKTYFYKNLAFYC